jgi:hypothetical protein
MKKIKNYNNFLNEEIFGLGKKRKKMEEIRLSRELERKKIRSHFNEITSKNNKIGEKNEKLPDFLKIKNSIKNEEYTIKKINNSHSHNKYTIILSTGEEITFIRIAQISDTEQYGWRILDEYYNVYLVYIDDKKLGEDGHITWGTWHNLTEDIEYAKEYGFLK